MHRVDPKTASYPKLIKMDEIYLEGREGVPGLFNKRYIRTRVMRFDMGNTVLNEEEIMVDPTIAVKRTTRYN